MTKIQAKIRVLARNICIKVIRNACSKSIKIYIYWYAESHTIAENANSRYEAFATFKHYCPKGNEHEANIQGGRKTVHVVFIIIKQNNRISETG